MRNTLYINLAFFNHCILVCRHRLLMNLALLTLVHTPSNFLLLYFKLIINFRYYPEYLMRCQWGSNFDNMQPWIVAHRYSEFDKLHYGESLLFPIEYQTVLCSYLYLFLFFYFCRSLNVFSHGYLLYPRLQDHIRTYMYIYRFNSIVQSDSLINKD